MKPMRPRWLVVASVAAVGLLILSGWQPYDRATWLMEVVPVIVALPVLWGTYRRFPLTDLLYALVFVHAVVLMIGGAYTYARVPLGFQLQDLLHLGRNPYDKMGHFFQGFVPALVARELLVRGDHVRGRCMLAFLVVCVVLAISATYELIEWGAALALGQGAEKFLGTQGDPWDTQSDMFFALIGAIVALATLSRVHDRQIGNLAGRGSSPPVVRPSALPAQALLSRYAHNGAFTDCYQVDVSEAVSFSDYVAAFYTTRLFKIERRILALFANQPSTDQEALALARGQTAHFSAWQVEDRRADQLLLCDFLGRTRSWLMAVPLGEGPARGTRLYFGSAVVPKSVSPSGQAEFGFAFHALDSLHDVYSRSLLRAAQAHLRSTAP